MVTATNQKCRGMWLQVGAHDGDWEHVTMRLSADGSKVLGVYYSAHRCGSAANESKPSDSQAILVLSLRAMDYQHN